MFPKRVLIRCVVRPDWDDLTDPDYLSYLSCCSRCHLVRITLKASLTSDEAAAVVLF